MALAVGTAIVLTATVVLIPGGGQRPAETPWLPADVTPASESVTLASPTEPTSPTRAELDVGEAVIDPIPEAGALVLDGLEADEFTVRVRTSDGSPLGDAQVTYRFGDDLRGVERRWTDEEACAAQFSYQGPGHVRAEHEDHGSSPWTEVSEWSPEVEVNLVGASIRGTLVDALGFGVDDCWVAATPLDRDLRDNDPPHVDGGYLYRSTQTEGDGYFELSGLRPGLYRLVGGNHPGLGDWQYPLLRTEPVRAPSSLGALRAAPLVLTVIAETHDGRRLPIDYLGQPRWGSLADGGVAVRVEPIGSELAVGELEERDVMLGDVEGDGTAAYVTFRSAAPHLVSLAHIEHGQATATVTPDALPTGPLVLRFPAPSTLACVAIDVGTTELFDIERSAARLHTVIHVFDLARRTWLAENVDLPTDRPLELRLPAGRYGFLATPDSSLRRADGDPRPAPTWRVAELRAGERSTVELTLARAGELLFATELDRTTIRDGVLTLVDLGPGPDRVLCDVDRSTEEGLPAGEFWYRPTRQAAPGRYRLVFEHERLVHRTEPFEVHAGERTWVRLVSARGPTEP